MLTKFLLFLSDVLTIWWHSLGMAMCYWLILLALIVIYIFSSRKFAEKIDSPRWYSEYRNNLFSWIGWFLLTGSSAIFGLVWTTGLGFMLVDVFHVAEQVKKSNLLAFSIPLIILMVLVPRGFLKLENVVNQKILSYFELNKHPRYAFSIMALCGVVVLLGNVLEAIFPTKGNAKAVFFLSLVAVVFGYFQLLKLILKRRIDKKAGK